VPRALPGAFLALSLWLSASAAFSPDPVQWSAAPAGPQSAGGVVLAVQATIQDSWYIYSMEQPENGPFPLRFRAPAESGASVGRVTAPTPRVSYDQGFRMRVGKYYGKPAFTVPVMLKGAASSVSLEVRYQACNDNICLPPRTKTVRVNLPRARR
jgi:hypothetical protein